IIKLLQYPEDSAGGLMINNIVCFGSGTLVETAREKLKKHARDLDYILLIFVIESMEKNNLAGTVSIRTLLDANGGDRLKDVMDPYVATLDPFEPASGAAFKLIGNQVAAMPVTDTEGGLLGTVTIDAAIAETVSTGTGLERLKVFS
ncbi:MAG: CBS domain-containing protein, partial [Pyrinomonadaceae bacterium]